MALLLFLSDYHVRTHFLCFNHIISCRFCIKLTFSHVFIGFLVHFYCHLSALKKSVLSSFSHSCICNRLHFPFAISSYIYIFIVLCVPFQILLCARSLRSSPKSKMKTLFISKCAPLFCARDVFLSILRTLNDKRQCIFIQTIWK